MGEPSVSVVVPAYNEATTIEGCLDPLLDQSYPRERYEVVVVDNGSTDGTAAVVEEYPVALVSTPDGGQYAARNAGIERATGDVLAFTDADVRVAGDWIESGVRAFERVGTDAVVYGRTRPSVDDEPDLWERYDAVRSFGGERRQTWNLFATQSVFDRVGRFREHFLSGGDLEWAGRVERSGIPIYHDDAVSAAHPPSDSPGALHRRHVRLGYGDGQRIRTENREPVGSLLAKEPLRLADWYAMAVRDLQEGSEWVRLSAVDRAAFVAMAVPLGVAMAYGRVRGLLENDPERSVGDYR
jgi:glycosyltransferase involved in cell wall biosynthesis